VTDRGCDDGLPVFGKIAGLLTFILFLINYFS